MNATDEASQPTPRQRRRLRELVASFLDSKGSQSEYLISILLAEATPESGDEPSLKVIRAVSSSIIGNLISLLRISDKRKTTSLLDFCALINRFPLEDGEESAALRLMFGTVEPDPRQIAQFRKLELLNLLFRLENYDLAHPLLLVMEPQVDFDNPLQRLIYRLSQARGLQHRGKRLEFASLWLRLISDYYHSEGADCALYLILRWIAMFNWGRETQLKQELLLRFGVGIRTRKDLLSATLLSELFAQENKLVLPEEKLHFARLLFKHPQHLLTDQQLQYLHFFAGNFYSGMKLSFLDSIRFYQHSNYFLHKSWDYLRRLSAFMRTELTPENFTLAMPYLEHLVIDLGSQISLQNNAYVETLHADYDMIRGLYKQVEELSITDNLTGLKNRRFLANNLGHLFQLAYRHKVPLGFAMLDIDNFKQINDKYGHLAGDHILKALAKLVAGNFRRSDVVIRYGGDEFLLILYDTSRDRFIHLMEDLRSRIEDHTFPYKGLPLAVTVSIGCSTDSDPNTTAKYLNKQIEIADKALYQAKNSGGNKVCAEAQENLS